MQTGDTTLLDLGRYKYLKRVYVSERQGVLLARMPKKGLTRSLDG